MELCLEWVPSDPERSDPLDREETEDREEREESDDSDDSKSEMSVLAGPSELGRSSSSWNTMRRVRARFRWTW
jgi:hypothetical protein